MMVDGSPGGRSPDYRQMWRHTLVRLLLTYLAPLVLLAVYFQVQYRSLAAESTRRHLVSIAESQAGTLDLFLRERVVNLGNLINDPTLPAPASAEAMQALLERLRRDSETFVDVGLFDRSGTMTSYAGPYPSLLARSYGAEPWFLSLAQGPARHVITDMYLGFRQRPHFTIAVRTAREAGPVAVRATLDPERLDAYLSSLRGSGEVLSLLVNAEGRYQLVSLPEALSDSGHALVPPREPVFGALGVATSDGRLEAGYCWLELTDWALVVVNPRATPGWLGAGVDRSLTAISAAVILAVLSAILIRARKVVLHQRDEDTARRELAGQLLHAARLASVGELAAGVAHEINNPLAVIAEEAGLLQDLLDPELAGEVGPDELLERLRSIHEATFRARDITRKLLSFVRKGNVRLGALDVNKLVGDVVGGLLEREMALANIRVERCLADDLPQVLADRGQLEQVLVNLVTNAIDAVDATESRGGCVTVSTSAEQEWVRISVSDTGTGIAPEHLERIFMPFFTTKEVGKGTGLGLSVSYGIVKSHGGDILVDSMPGHGSIFTLVLPASPRQTSRGGSIRADRGVEEERARCIAAQEG